VRAAVVTHLFPSPGALGRGVFVLEQTRALAALVDVRVIVPAEAVSTASSSPAHLGTESLGIGEPTGGRLRYLVWCLRYVATMKRRARDLLADVDVVHAHFAFPDGVAAVQAARRAGRPVVVTLHGSDVDRILGRNDPLGAYVRGWLARADALICVSETMASKVRTLRGLEDCRIVSVMNGYNDGLFDVGPSPRTGGFLFVGGLRAVKNPVELVRAYASIADAVIWPLTLIGEGPLRGQIEDLIGAFGLGDRVRLRGFRGRGEVAEAMKHANMLVLPSAREGLPISVIEALACGTPVVASRVGGIPEVVSDANGMLVDPGDTDALADALQTVASREWDPVEVRLVSQVRPWSVVAEELAELYGEIVARRGEAS
jgi:teichuronic acid biosynthesis glycosyltransferase TuaC